MLKLAGSVVALAIAASPAFAQVTEEQLANDAMSTGDVLTNGMGRHLQRYSPLDMLNKDNVKNLVPAWAFSLGGEKQRGFETQPLVHDGVMYITASYSRMYAIDVETGQELWQYDARLPEGILPCCDVVNRGAAIYGDKVYFGTLDARIVALNAKTGDVVWRKKIADYKAGYSYTAAPLIVNGLIVTGNSGGEFGIVGSVQARDAETGDLVWERPVIEGHMGTLNGEESTMTGTLSFEDKDGNKRYATADRNGFFYVLNRDDGAFVGGWPFVKDISWATGLDDNGRPIWNEANRPGNPVEAADGKKGEVVFSSPSFLGGKNWMPMAHSPKTGFFYVPSNEWGMDIWNEPVTYKKGAAYLGSGFTIKPNYEDHIGTLKAIDPKTGEWVWEVKNDAPLWGGVMATAGGLVFTGTPEGFLKAFDDETGEELWRFQTGSGIVGQPVTWDMNGEQYVAIASGWGGAVPLWGGEVAKKVNYLNQGGTMWVFKLPKQMMASN